MKRRAILVLVTTTFLFFPYSSQNVEATMYFNDGNTHIVDYTISENVLVTMNYWEEPTSVILVSGGLIDAQLTVSHSQVEIWGGLVLDNLQFHENSLINILNGVIDGDLYSSYNSQITISGGSLGGKFTPFNDSVLTIVGSGFAIDGSPVGYGELFSIFGGSYIFEPFRTLTGTLANGDLINNQFRIGENAKIILTPVPSAVLLGSIGLTFSGWLLHRKKMT